MIWIEKLKQSPALGRIQTHVLLIGRLAFEPLQSLQPFLLQFSFCLLCSQTTAMVEEATEEIFDTIFVGIQYVADEWKGRLKA